MTAPLYLGGFLGQPVNGRRVTLHLLQLLQSLVFQRLHPSLGTHNNTDMRKRGSSWGRDPEPVHTICQRETSVPRTLPLRGDARGGVRVPGSVLLPPQPPPLPGETKEPLLPAMNSKMRESTRQPEGKRRCSSTESRWKRQERARPPGTETKLARGGPRALAQLALWKVSSSVRTRNTPHLHTLGPCGFNGTARGRRYLLCLGHQRPWVPSGVLCNCGPCRMPQKWTVRVTPSSSH